MPNLGINNEKGIKGTFELTPDGKLVLKPEGKLKKPTSTLVWYWVGDPGWSGANVTTGTLLFAEDPDNPGELVLGCVSDVHITINLEELVKTVSDRIGKQIPASLKVHAASIQTDDLKKLGKGKA
jgi:hypothetical protein